MKMVQYGMKARSKKTKLTAEGFIILRTVFTQKENLKNKRLMVKERYIVKTVPLNMKANGKMENVMEKELYIIQMVQ